MVGVGGAGVGQRGCGPAGGSKPSRIEAAHIGVYPLMIGIGSVACQLDTFPMLAWVEHGPFRDRYGADLDRVTGTIIRVAGLSGPRRDVDVKVSAAHPEIRVKRVHGGLAQPGGSPL